MDANDDVRDCKVTKALMEIGMYEAVISNHNGESVTATCATNKQRKPIDSIWTSPGLTVLRCGFLPFHNVYGFHSNHRLIWADICNNDMLGHRPQHIYRAPRSKVRSNDPDIREKYIQRCINKYGSEDVINNFLTLSFFCQTTCDGKDMRNEINHLHASLSKKIEKIQMDVDKSISQFFTGFIPWSPTIQVHRDRIDYWHCVLRIKTGVLTSKNAIKKLSIKLDEYSGHYLTTLAFLNKLKIAWKDYRAAKKVGWSLRETFLQEKLLEKQKIEILP